MNRLGVYVWMLSAAAVAAAAGEWDIRRLDTARDVDYMSALEKDVVLEMNKARSEPRRYAEEYIRPQLQSYSGDAYSAAVECIDELSRAKSAEPLLPEKGLYLAARDHAADQANTGATGHTGSDGSAFSDRLSRYGKWAGAAAENISYGKDDGRKIVLSLLIDAGVPSRGHRKNIMNSVYTHTGAAAGTHKVYRTACVIDYAKNYTTTAAQPAKEPAPAKTAEAALTPAARPLSQPAATPELDKVLTGRGGAVEVFNRAITPGRSVAVLTVGSDYPRLSEYIVDAITAKLFGGGRYKVIDRAGINEVANRKDMGLDDDLARYLGQKAGAQTVIFGSVKTQGASGASLRLEIKALDVGRGRVIDRFGRTIERADAEGLLTDAETLRNAASD
jgi:uncharacterized protein YkwD